MKRKGLIVSLLISITWLSSCYKDVEEELYPCVNNSLSYSIEIEPIINVNCNACHYGAASSSGTQLDTYETLTQVISRPSAEFFCRIKWEAGCSPMPQNSSKLSDCSISKIEQWTILGFPK